MRKVLIFCIILLLILSAAPFVGVCIASKDISNSLFKRESIPQNTTATEATETEDTSADSEYIISSAISLCNENFCDEGIKAALSIAENNCYYLETQGNSKNNTATNEYSDEFYERVKNIYKGLDAVLKYKGECVYIPTSSLSDGSTDTDDKYPYMAAVASPWDCLSEEFIYDKEYSCGVSMQGINYLCSEGMSYKEALQWYLPYFDIK